MALPYTLFGARSAEAERASASGDHVDGGRIGSRPAGLHRHALCVPSERETGPRRPTPAPLPPNARERLSVTIRGAGDERFGEAGGGGVWLDQQAGGVAIVAFDGELGGVAVAAVDAHGFQRRLVRGFRGVAACEAGGD